MPVHKTYKATADNWLFFIMSLEDVVKMETNDLREFARQPNWDQFGHKHVFKADNEFMAALIAHAWAFQNGFSVTDTTSILLRESDL